MRIASDAIKTVIKEVCKEQGNEDQYELICKVFDYIARQENLPNFDRNERIKAILDKEIARRK